MYELSSNAWQKFGQNKMFPIESVPSHILAKIVCLFVQSESSVYIWEKWQKLKFISFSGRFMCAYWRISYSIHQIQLIFCVRYYFSLSSSSLRINKTGSSFVCHQLRINVVLSGCQISSIKS